MKSSVPPRLPNYFPHFLVSSTNSHGTTSLLPIYERRVTYSGGRKTNFS